MTSCHDDRFGWTAFYEAVANRLLMHQRDRTQLIESLHTIASRVPTLRYLQKDKRTANGPEEPLTDICPFTALGTFNRGTTDDNRKIIARELAELLGVEVPVPDSFEGIPVLDNRKSWYFGKTHVRGDDDIDVLWAVLEAAVQFADSTQPERRETLEEAYSAATTVHGVAWNLSMGLYWARPRSFVTLDGRSYDYIRDRLGLRVPSTPRDTKRYVALLDDLQERFANEKFPIKSFPELSLKAWLGEDPDGPELPERNEPLPVDPRKGSVRKQSAAEGAVLATPYSIDDILKDGCFLARDEIERLLNRLRAKKNLILQGPPGTGKTWLARRLAFALIGARDESKVRAVQFHPNLSYEDFVRGWRPSSDGSLEVADGVFMDAIKAAARDPDAQFVVVIEEINRGNPAQVFGELLTLLEPDKRIPEEALQLCYPDSDGKSRPVHVPENLHVIGTMNIADRSLALVDLAFRRRFAFATLKPQFGVAWRRWAVEKGGLDDELASDIEQRMARLNERIADGLGSQFCIGHSYVTPTHRLEDGDTRDWFIEVAQTEIGPLLEEYWFDSLKTAKDAIEELTRDW